MDISSDFYHGSKEYRLNSISRDFATCCAAFGPVIYLSSEYRVAECYGNVHLIKLLGDPEKTIDYNKPISSQTRHARNAIHSLFMNFKWDYDCSENSRDEVERLGRVYGMKTIFDCLYTLNIWMVYGKLTGIEGSGLRDRGIQYGIIDSRRISSVLLIT